MAANLLGLKARSTSPARKSAFHSFSNLAQGSVPLSFMFLVKKRTKSKKMATSSMVTATLPLHFSLGKPRNFAIRLSLGRSARSSGVIAFGHHEADEE